jgi:hypothetical protein
MVVVYVCKRNERCKGRGLPRSQGSLRKMDIKKITCFNKRYGIEEA